jgi:hypothetical protein
MPRTYTYPTINTVSVTTRSKAGTSDTATLKALFSGAPGNVEYQGADGAQEYRKKALELLLKGEISDNLQVGTVDRDFGLNAGDAWRQPPDLKKVKTGAEGLPASPWVPNPTSPGPGSSNPKDLGEAPKDYGIAPSTSLSNDGSSQDATSDSRNPAISSQRMSLGAEVGTYEAGKSPATANAS